MAEPNSDGGGAGQPLADLAKALAAVAKPMRQKFLERYARESPQEPLHSMVSGLLANLVLDMAVPDLADNIAQAITCGLATLRAIAREGESFTPGAALEHLPPTHPIIRNFFTYILQGVFKGSPPTREFLPKAIAVDLGIPDLIHLLDAPWVGALFQPSTRVPGNLDPAIHLYEAFLQAYNAEKRAQRGVFYTPDAVISFIVRSVDAILRRDCGCAGGFFDPHVGNILDPATGTGTFLGHVVGIIRHAFDETQGNPSPGPQASVWVDYVHRQLLPRVMGCEVLLAPFIVAHVLLGRALEETGFRFDKGQRLGVYLANVLEVGLPPLPTKLPQGTLDNRFPRDPGGLDGRLPAPHETDVARSAMQGARCHVIIGNPPYARKSQNVTPAIQQLIAPYKRAVRSERNIQALSDDYLKFLRLAQVLVEQAGWGVVGFVLNNRFLTGGIYRGVRESLETTFDMLYVLNLHGGKKGYERVPAGVVDENVFPIAQGVCVCLLVKCPSPAPKLARQIYYYDLFGSQSEKLDFITRAGLQTVPWITLPLAPPGSPFALDSVSPALGAEWETYTPLDHLFSFYNVGGKPGDDDLLVSVRREAVLPKLEAFLRASRGRARDPGTRLTEARQKILERGDSVTLDPAHVEPYLYRPFDLRWVYYDPTMWTRGVPALKAQCRGTMLLMCAKIVTDPAWAHVLAATTFPDVIALSNSTSVNCYVFPARVSETASAPPAWNLTPAFRAYLTTRGVDLDSAGEADVLGYLYAVLSSPAYRSRYDLLLRGGRFPRVPLVPDGGLFARLSSLGRQLLALHADLAQRPTPTDIHSDVRPGTTVAPGYPRFKDNAIYLSPKDKFAPVLPEVWQFVVGKYSVCRQWLVARVKDPLSAEDITFFLQLLGILRDTVALISEIDATIASGGSFPLASVPLGAPSTGSPSPPKAL